jgi:hypothetical protein
MDSQQPIKPSTETAHAGDKAQVQKKERFTRAERRAYIKEKKGAQNGKKGAQQLKKRKGKPATRTQPQAAGQTVDDIIAYLLTVRGKEGNHKLGDILPSVTKSLETRVTRDAPKAPKQKKELSAAKLEKIQKRKEARVEKRRVIRCPGLKTSATTNSSYDESSPEIIRCPGVPRVVSPARVSEESVPEVPVTKTPEPGVIYCPEVGGAYIPARRTEETTPEVKRCGGVIHPNATEQAVPKVSDCEVVQEEEDEKAFDEIDFSD